MDIEKKVQKIIMRRGAHKVVGVKLSTLQGMRTNFRKGKMTRAKMLEILFNAGEIVAKESATQSR